MDLFGSNNQIQPDNFSDFGAHLPSRVSTFVIYNLVKDGSVEIRGNELVPTQEFISEIALDTKAGRLTQIAFQNVECETEKISSRQVVAALKQSDLIQFQVKLAAGLADWMKQQNMDLSVHGRELQNSELQEIPGFSSHCAKIVPLHRDLAEFPTSEGITLSPANFSLISWGGRAKTLAPTTLHYVPAPLSESWMREHEERLLDSRPQLSIVKELYDKENSENDLCIQLPDTCLTIFGNSSSFHGATWSEYRAGRNVNRLIKRQVQNGEDIAGMFRPIHVILL